MRREAIRRIGVFACAALAGALAVAPAHAQDGGPSIETVKRTVALPANAETVFTVLCPRNYFAAGASVNAPRATVLSSRPEGTRRWRFDVLRPDTAGSAKATLRCVSLVAPVGAGPPSMGVSTVTTRELTLLPGETRFLNLPCRRGHVPLSAGFDREGFSPVSIFRSLHIRRGRKGWRFRTYNRGTRNALVELLVRCVRPSSSARKGGTRYRHRFRIRQRVFSEARLGTNFRRSCRRGEVSVGAGYDVPRDAVLAGDPLLSRTRSVRFRFQRLLGTVSSGRAAVSCLSARTAFRRVG